MLRDKETNKNISCQDFEGKNVFLCIIYVCVRMCFLQTTLNIMYHICKNITTIKSLSCYYSMASQDVICYFVNVIDRKMEFVKSFETKKEHD